MLQDGGFVEWANENMIVAIAHETEEHPSQIEDENGEKVEGCPKYPGLLCEDHRGIANEIAALTSASGLPQIKKPVSTPTSWFVMPNGEVETVSNAYKTKPKKVIEMAQAGLKKLKLKHLPMKKYKAYVASLDAGDAAIETMDWKAALAAYADVEKDTKKLPDGMKEIVKERLDDLNEAIVEAFEELKEGEGDAEAKIKAAGQLKSAVGKRLKRGYLPVVDDIKKWIKEAKAK